MFRTVHQCPFLFQRKQLLLLKQFNCYSDTLLSISHHFSPFIKPAQKNYGEKEHFYKVTNNQKELLFCRCSKQNPNKLKPLLLTLEFYRFIKGW